MLLFLIKSLICTALLYGVYKISFREETYFTTARIYLLSILTLSIAIPLVHIPVSFSVETSFDTLFSYMIEGARNLLFVNLLDEVVIWGSPSGVNWVLWLERLYIIGILIFSLRLLRFFFEILRLHTKSKKHKVGNINLYIHQESYTAFSFLNNVYVNKEEFREASFRVVWKHELEHIRQLHTFESFMLELLCCLFWFNPIVWICRSNLKELHEFLVDESMLKQGVDSLSYQKYLVNYAFGGDVFTSGNHFAVVSVKRRIQMMDRNRHEIFHRWKFVFMLPVLLLLLCAFSLDQAEDAVVQEDEIVLESPTS